ncbi:MAG: 30S ribosomal protein S14 [Parvibaculum sp.]
MAKKSAINRDQKRRKLVAKFANKRAKLKAMTTDAKLSMEERFDAQLKLAELPRNSSKTRVHNRCEISGRSKAYYRKLRMSRIALRDLASRGQIPGMVKSSW